METRCGPANMVKMVARYSKKNAKVREAELAHDMNCSAVESMVSDNLERHLQQNAKRLKKIRRCCTSAGNRSRDKIT